MRKSRFSEKQIIVILKELKKLDASKNLAV